MAELRYAVYLDDPEQPGESVRFLPGDEIPEWAQALITNPNCWVDGELPAAKSDDSEPVAPPRAGKGSGRDEWAAYAASLGVEVDAEAGRDDIIAAIDAQS